MPKDHLLTFEFLSLCFITFAAVCNVSVFFNFHLYLQGIGFSGKEAGFIIGLYSLSAMALYVTASQYIHLGNALKCMTTGILLVVGCGVAYLFANQFRELVLVRIVNGIGMFLVMASCMVMLVAIIPQKKSGLAFSLYSVALLLPYSIMPAVSEVVLPLIARPTTMYLLTACLLLPAVFLARSLRTRVRNRLLAQEKKREGIFCKDSERKNLLRKPVIAILLVNGIYFIIFSALFYLFEGFAVAKGMKNPGYFFTTQMGVMIVIRLLGGRIFDKFSKVALVAIALSITGAGFVLLRVMPDQTWLLPIAVLFGLGMGLCVPPLNSLMYLNTSPQFRGYNANMMMLVLHIGSFTGSFFGSWIIASGGYNQFLVVAAVLAVGAAGFFLAVNPAPEISMGLRK
ncbi:MAG: MFS transporter [Desulfobulbaceae bacterium]|nr:MFS transporter [Desulfobulbaceae bacterium]